MKNNDDSRFGAASAARTRRIGNVMSRQAFIDHRYGYSLDV